MAPNFDRLLKVFWREQPDRVPFYEHLVDTIVMETIMGKPIPPPMRGMRSRLQNGHQKKHFCNIWSIFLKDWVMTMFL